jgi:predicted dehydrogenase
MNKQKIKVAFIGAGYMTSEHIKAFGAIQDVTLVGIYSKTRGRAENMAVLYPGMIVCDSIEELNLKLKPDLVVISVPELSTKSVCLEAFKYPWKCLIEKPVGYNLAESKYILKAAEVSKVSAFVAFNRRHYGSTRQVLEELDPESDIRMVQVFDQENPPVALETGVHPLITNNWMFANSIHIIDYFRMFCRGEVLHLNHIVPWTPENPQYVVTQLQYSSGDIGMYLAVWNGPGPWAVSVTTNKKRFEMRPLEQAFRQVFKSRSAEPLPSHAWDTDFKPGLRLQAEEAVRAAKGLSHNLPDLAEGYESMKLISQIYAI